MLSPVQAYEKARMEGPSEYTRKAVLCDVLYSYYYARHIDKYPRDDTRQAILSNVEFSYCYALYVDKNIFIDSYNIYFVDIHNIGIRYIRKYKYKYECDVGFMPVGCFYLDVL